MENRVEQGGQGGQGGTISPKMRPQEWLSKDTNVAFAIESDRGVSKTIVNLSDSQTILIDLRFAVNFVSTTSALEEKTKTTWFDAGWSNSRTRLLTFHQRRLLITSDASLLQKPLLTSLSEPMADTGRRVSNWALLVFNVGSPDLMLAHTTTSTISRSPREDFWHSLFLSALLVHPGFGLVRR